MATTPLQLEHLTHLGLKPRRQATLQAFCNALIDLLGDDLVAIYLFGAAVVGDWDPDNDNVDLLIVQEKLDFNELQRVAAALDQQRRALVTPLFMTRAEVLQSSDVYSLRFDDLKRHHRHLAGEALLEQLTIDPEQLRFVCELQLRNIVLQLRNFYIRSHNQPKLEQKTLMTLLESSRLPLLTLHRMLELGEASTRLAVMKSLAEGLDVDIEALVEHHSVLQQGGRLNQHALAQAYSTFNQLILHAVERVDRM
ncbi:MAG: hypothetical protein AAFX99_16565 [Myxococcota bacterium]